MQYIAAIYPNPASGSNPGTPNTNPADQIGCPYGYTDDNIANAPNYPGKKGSSFLYSQLIVQLSEELMHGCIMLRMHKRNFF